MRRQLTILLSIFVAYFISKWVFEQAGDPASKGKKKKKFPKNLADLNSEIPGLPTPIQKTFDSGVNSQLSGNKDEARKAYNKLRILPQEGKGKIDLYQKSKAFRHNYDLLDNDD